MANDNALLMGMALGCILLGISCLFLVHCRCSHWARVGRRLFVMALLGLGGVGLIAAIYRADGLAPLGLAAGLLVTAMLSGSGEWVVDSAE